MPTSNSVGGDERPTITVPQICNKHQREIVTRLRLRPSDAWRAAVIIVNILLFQKIVARDAVSKSAEHDANNLSGVLSEIGCLACYSPKVLAGALSLIKRRGQHVAAQVSQMKDNDAEWEKIT